jgi:hypothetical protein
MKKLFLYLLFVLFASQANAQATLHFKNVWVEPNESEQIALSTANGYKKANEILDSLQIGKNYAIKLYTWNGQKHYIQALHQTNPVEDMLGNKASFSHAEIKKKYQNEALAHMDTLSQQHQQKALQFAAQPSLTRTVILNLTILQMVLFSNETIGGLKITRKNYAKLQIVTTPDIEESIRGKFAPIWSQFELELTQNVAENELKIANWLRRLAPKLNSNNNPCANSFEHTVSIDQKNLSEIMSYYFKCYGRWAKEVDSQGHPTLIIEPTEEQKKMLQDKINLACLCNNLQPMQSTPVGSKVRIPMTDEERIAHEKCVHTGIPLPNAIKEIQIVEALATQYNKKVYAYNLLEKTRAEAMVLFKPQEKRPYWHLVTHGKCSGLGFLTLKMEEGTINKNDIRDNVQIGTPELLFLNICQTALGGKYSIVQSFIDKGVKRGIGALWNVKDVPAPEFVRLFYTNLFANPTKSAEQVLRETRLEASKNPDTGIDGLGNPRNWAIYDYFENKYKTTIFEDYGADEAKVELDLNEDKITYKITIKIQGKTDKVINFLEIKYFASLTRCINFSTFNGTAIKNAYKFMWQDTHTYLKSNNIKKIYLKVAASLSAAIKECSANNSDCDAGEWTFLVFREDYTTNDDGEIKNNHILAYYDIILLH